MPTLSESLLEPSRRPAVVADLTRAVEAEVDSKGGLSGAAIKAGFKAVSKLSPDLVGKAVNAMLPEWAERLEPLWQSRGEQPFGAYLAANSGQAADALLAVTDERAAQPKHAKVAKIYNGLRPKAKDQVEAALPRIGSVIENAAR